MAKLVAVTACPTGIAHTFMAAEALRRAALAAGHDIRVETQGSVGTADALTPSEIAAADAVILATDVRVNEDRFAGKPVVHATSQGAIRGAAQLIAQAVAPAATALAAPAPANSAPASSAPATPAPATPAAASSSSDSLTSGSPISGSLISGPAQSGYVVGVTSCPTGIAHTFMAAEGLESGAKSLGYDVKIETQGSVGAGNPLSADDIRRADVVVIAADTNVDLNRFAGKRVYQIGTKPAIRDGAAVVRTALAEAPVYGAAGAGVTRTSGPVTSGAVTSGSVTSGAAPGSDSVPGTAAKAASNAGAPSFYRHLMTGVSFMLPFVVAGGLLIALGFAFGGINPAEGSFGAVLKGIGGDAAFKLFVPVLAGYIAFSIADRPGLAPGMIGGYLAMTGGSGFLGGLAAGFIAGYLVRWLNQALRLPRTLEGLKPTLLLPLFGTLLTGLLMVYAIGTPVKALLDAATAWLQGLGQSSAGLLGAVIGGMMAFDMGGPINKAAYTFGVGLQASQVNGPIAAAMAAGMTPPLALFLATQFFRNRFTADEREAGKAAGVLGLSFITEGAIPFAARDPLRVIPALVAGSAVAGAISMAMGCLLAAPHGGIFVLAIPGAVTNLPMYIVAIVAGTVVSTLLLGLLKKPLAPSALAGEEGAS